MIDNLLLLSGNDIPFIEANLVIHNPTIKEIAYVGEMNFFIGYQMLLISKNVLTEEDKVSLEKLTNFDIFIAILKEQNAVMKKNKDCAKMVLELLFPGYIISFLKDKIIFKKENSDEEKSLDKTNFDAFQNIIKTLFSFGDDGDVPQEFKPIGDAAKRIADKLKKRHQILSAKEKDENQDILGRYVSNISIALGLPITIVFNYTISQLYDQIKRYQLKSSYDIYIKAKLAGAQDLEDPED